MARIRALGSGCSPWRADRGDWVRCQTASAYARATVGRQRGKPLRGSVARSVRPIDRGSARFPGKPSRRRSRHKTYPATDPKRSACQSRKLRRTTVTSLVSFRASLRARVACSRCSASCRQISPSMRCGDTRTPLGETRSRPASFQPAQGPDSGVWLRITRS